MANRIAALKHPRMQDMTREVFAAVFAAFGAIAPTNVPTRVEVAIERANEIRQRIVPDCATIA